MSELLRRLGVQAVKDVNANYDAVVDLFEVICIFLKRLDIYTTIPLTTFMTEIIVKIMIELISILAVSTKQIKQGRLSMSIVPDTSLNLLRCREIWKEAPRRQLCRGSAM